MPKKKTSTKKTKKKTTKKLPFDVGMSKGAKTTTVHILVGVDSQANAITYGPHESETMDAACSELLSSFDFTERVEIHHLVTILPLPKAPKITKVRAKKIKTREPEPQLPPDPSTNGRGRSGISHATNPGAA